MNRHCKHCQEFLWCLIGTIFASAVFGFVGGFLFIFALALFVLYVWDMAEAIDDRTPILWRQKRINLAFQFLGMCVGTILLMIAKGVAKWLTY